MNGFIDLTEAFVAMVLQLSTHHPAPLPQHAYVPAVVQTAIPAQARPLPQLPGGHALRRPVSLCELLSYAAYAGLYRVDAMASVVESGADMQGATVAGPITYVTLSRLKAWELKAPVQVVARMRGGPTGVKGVRRAGDVALKVGETIGYVGYFLPAHKGYAGISELNVFRADAVSGFSNGQLFKNAIWSGDNVATVIGWNLAAKGTCPLEVWPDDAASNVGGSSTVTAPTSPTTTEAP
jgi:hypothetical protein